MSAPLALQKVIRARLVAASAVTALVPTANILDRNSRPAPDPSIILGEDQEVDQDRNDRAVTLIYATMHVWKIEPSLVGVKAIAGAIRTALAAPNLTDESDGYHFADLHVSGVRFLRDPDGETSHGVVTVEAYATEVA